MVCVVLSAMSVNLKRVAKGSNKIGTQTTILNVFFECLFILEVTNNLYATSHVIM